VGGGSGLLGQRLPMLCTAVPVTGNSRAPARKRRKLRHVPAAAPEPAAAAATSPVQPPAHNRGAAAAHNLLSPPHHSEHGRGRGGLRFTGS
jgi:hypothetical protein